MHCVKLMAIFVTMDLKRSVGINFALAYGGNVLLIMQEQLPSAEHIEGAATDGEALAEDNQCGRVHP